MSGGASGLARSSDAPWFDPGWLIRRTLDVGLDELPGAAEDALLAWIVRLPADQDPAEAAGRVLAAYADGLAEPSAGRLSALLEETRGYPPARLAQVRPQRRRGRRRDRRGATAP